MSNICLSSSLLMAHSSFSHDKALEAITVCGELEKRGRFSKIVEALDDDHTNLKVKLQANDVHIINSALKYLSREG